MYLASGSSADRSSQLPILGLHSLMFPIGDSEGTMSMSVVLRPETKEHIQQLIETWSFQDADSVVTEALDLLEQRYQLERLRSAIFVGIEQINRGETVELTDDFLERSMARARDRSRRGLPVSDDVKS